MHGSLETLVDVLYDPYGSLNLKAMTVAVSKMNTEDFTVGFNCLCRSHDIGCQNVLYISCENGHGSFLSDCSSAVLVFKLA